MRKLSMKLKEKNMIIVKFVFILGFRIMNIDCKMYLSGCFWLFIDGL